MNEKLRFGWTGIAARAGLAALIGFAAPWAAGAAWAGELSVTVNGVASSEGFVMAALFADGATWEKRQKAQGLKTKAQAGKMVLRFSGLKPGRYMVAVYHDLNGNGKLDKNLVGMPTEPYGFSRNTRGVFSAPSFDDAAVRLREEAMEISLDVF